MTVNNFNNFVFNFVLKFLILVIVFNNKSKHCLKIAYSLFTFIFTYHMGDMLAFSLPLYYEPPESSGLLLK